MKARGLSLAETIMALFLLAGGCLGCLTLLSQGLAHNARTTQVWEASDLAERSVDAIRRWAYDPANYFGSWALYDNDTLVFPDSPWQVQVVAGPRSPSYSPNTSLEAPRGADARIMADSYVPVQITVSGGRIRPLQWTTHIFKPVQPVRTGSEIQITRGTGPADPIPPMGQVEFSATLHADTGQVIPGVAMQWQVIPYEAPGYLPGNCFFYPDRGSMGRQGRLQHRFYGSDPVLNLPPYKVPGWVVLRAAAVYQGVEYSRESAPIELAN